jgi:isoquinoline 1-oxidoreductase beta subunit
MSAVLSRRGWLQLSGAGLTVALFGGCALPVIPKRPAPSLDDALGWVRHDGDGRYTLWLPRVEMGQGILTALEQVACVELGVGWDAVDVQLPGTRDIGRVKATVGSDSIKDFALPLAQGCALLREAVARGSFPAVGDTPPLLRWPAAHRPDLADPPLAQGRAIVTGRPLYVADVRRPGMVFGRVLYAPLSPEFASAPRVFDAAAAQAQPGFVALVHDERLGQGQARGVGIVAATLGALDRIERALAVQWQTQEPKAGWRELLDIDARLAQDPR